MADIGSMAMYAGVALVIFVILDGLWLKVIARRLYDEQLEYLMKENPNLIAAGVFYIMFVLGLEFFVITPAIVDANIAYAVLAGLFYGFVGYSSFNLINLAIVRDWPISITLVDLAWSSVIASGTSVLTYLIFI